MQMTLMIANIDDLNDHDVITRILYKFHHYSVTIGDNGDLLTCYSSSLSRTLHLLLLFSTLDPFLKSFPP